MILEIGSGAIKSGELRECQKNAQAGLYALAMGGFLKWIAHDYEGVRAAFATKVSEYRAIALGTNGHARTPEIVSNLHAGFELLLAFAADFSPVTPPHRRSLSSRPSTALPE